MKKIILALIILISSSLAYASDEIKLESEPLKLAIRSVEPNLDKIAIEDTQNPKLDLFDTPVERQNKFYTSIFNTSNIAKLNTVKPMLEEPLTQHFERGPLESLHEWGVLQMNMTETISEDGNTLSKYNVGLINALIDGKFRGGKEGFRIMLDPTPQDTRNFFQPFIQDLYIETKRIPHHTILVGNSRPVVGHEGAASPYTLPFLNRSQISRHFGTVRKFGIRLHGDYSLVDYDLAGLSSDTYFTEFFPGAEFNGWVNLKPLGLTDGRYGKLTLGGGVVAGGRNAQNFFVAGSYLGYEYKKFWLKAEYACSNGSNGATGLSDKNRHGWYTTVGYHLTDKLEVLARYDEFDPDKNISNNNSREYTAGINYYIKGQALKLLLNYVFCQNDNKPNSHRIVIGTQIAL